VIILHEGRILADGSSGRLTAPGGTLKDAFDALIRKAAA